MKLKISTGLLFFKKAIEVTLGLYTFLPKTAISLVWKDCRLFTVQLEPVLFFCGRVFSTTS